MRFPDFMLVGIFEESFLFERKGYIFLTDFLLLCRLWEGLGKGGEGDQGSRFIGGRSDYPSHEISGFNLPAPLA